MKRTSTHDDGGFIFSLQFWVLLGPSAASHTGCRRQRVEEIGATGMALMSVAYSPLGLGGGGGRNTTRARRILTQCIPAFIPQWPAACGKPTCYSFERLRFASLPGGPACCREEWFAVSEVSIWLAQEKYGPDRESEAAEPCVPRPARRGTCVGASRCRAARARGRRWWGSSKHRYHRPARPAPGTRRCRAKVEVTEPVRAHWRQESACVPTLSGIQAFLAGDDNLCASAALRAASDVLRSARAGGSLRAYLRHRITRAAECTRSRCRYGYFPVSAVRSFPHLSSLCACALSSFSCTVDPALCDMQADGEEAEVKLLASVCPQGAPVCFNDGATR